MKTSHWNKDQSNEGKVVSNKNQVFKLIGTGLGLLLSLNLISCTRADDSNSSQISISLPQNMASQKAGKQAATDLVHLIINVTGDGIPSAVVYTWDAHRGNTITAPPPSHALTVPQGSNRVVRVLAVYTDSATGGSMQFFYGESTPRNFTKTEEPGIPVIVTSIGKGKPIYSGRIAGRYMTAPNSGPTGYVDILFNPAGGIPMVVDRAMMYNGWFQVFGLIGAKFSYRAPNGEILFGGPIEVTSANFPPAPNRMTVTVPAHQRSHGDSSGGALQMEQEDASVYVYGFFGDPGATAGKVVCKDTSVALSRMYKSGDSATKLTMADGGTPPADLAATNVASIFVQGGVAKGTAPCTQALFDDNPYTEALSFNSAMVENGNDASAGFDGPFIRQQSGGSSLMKVTSPDTSSKTLTGKLLPGVTSQFDQFAMFKKVTTEEYNDTGSISCRNLVSEMGFTSLGVSNVSGASWTATLPISKAEGDAGVVVVLCPMKNGGMAEVGVWLRKWEFMDYGGGSSGGGGGGGSYSNPPTQIKLTVQDNLSTLNQNSCVPVSVQLLGADNNPAFYQGSYTVALGGTGQVGFWHMQDSNCVNGWDQVSSGNLTFSYGQSAMIVYMKVVSSSGVKDLTASSSGLTSASKSLTVNATSGTFSQLRFVSLDLGNPNAAPFTFNNSTNLLMPDVCTMAILQLQDLTGAPVPSVTHMTSNVFDSVSSIFAGGSLYSRSDMNCIGSATTNHSWANSAGTNYFANNPVMIKLNYGSTITLFSGIFLGVSGIASSTIGAATLPPATDIGFRLVGEIWDSGTQTTKIPRGVCLPMLVTALDDSGGPATPGTTRLIQVSGSATGTTPPTVTIYPNSNCTYGGSASKDVSVITGYHRADTFVFLKVTGGSTDSQVSLSATDVTGSGTVLSSATLPANPGQSVGVFSPVLTLSYDTSAGVNGKWVALSPPTWSSPNANVGICRTIKAELQDGNGNPYNPPTQVNFTATRTGAATNGFKIGSCGGSIGNSYSFAPGNAWTSIYFNANSASLELGSQSITLVGSSPDFVSGPSLEMAVGLKFKANVGTLTPGTCNNLTGTLVTNSPAEYPVVPLSDFGGAPAMALSFGVTGGTTTMHSAPGCASAGSIGFGMSASSSIPYSLNAASGTFVPSLVSPTFSLGDQTWATTNILVVP